MINLTTIQNAAKALLAKAQCFKSFKLSSNPVLLVLTVGKVGSAAVYETIKSQCDGIEIYHFHFLSGRLQQVKQEYMSTASKRIPFHVYIGEEIGKYLPEILNSSRQVYIVTLVRDPIAFVLSDVFQNPEFTASDLVTVSNANKNYIASQARERILAMKYLPYIQAWFYSEIRDHFGIDVFISDFDKNNGYQVYRKSNISLLLIRLEDLTEKGVQAIADLIPFASPLKLKKRNIRGDGVDAGLYEYVRTSLKLDNNVLTEIYSSSLVAHFYSSADIQRFVKRWEGPNELLSSDVCITHSKV